jgi:predicted MFS family arabinose efflux permease
VILVGLAVFGVVFALNSAVHSYLVLAYADSDRLSVTVGFYYMANAMGRLLGTLLSGLLYQHGGIIGSLWGSAALAAVAGGTALFLPRVTAEAAWSSVRGDD